LRQSKLEVPKTPEKKIEPPTPVKIIEKEVVRAPAFEFQLPKMQLVEVPKMSAE
jgi:hypothetical protein